MPSDTDLGSPTNGPLNQSGHLRRLRIVIGAAAVLLALLLYYFGPWRPLGANDHGTPIQPARTLPEVAVRRVPTAAGAIMAVTGSGVGASVGATSSVASSSLILSRKWSLVFIGNGACNDDCRQTLQFMQTVQGGLDALAARTQRVFLVSAQCCDHDYLRRAQADLLTLDASSAGAQPLLDAFPGDARGAVFVVDPGSRIVLRYSASANPRGLREELRRLLASGPG